MAFVVLMGMGTVFFGLICIIFLTTAMGKVMSSNAKSAPAAVTPAAAATPAVAASAAETAAEPEVTPEMLAVITAVLSEEVDTSANGINIVNIKRKAIKAAPGQETESEVAAIITAVLSDEIGSNDTISIQKF